MSNRFTEKAEKALNRTVEAAESFGHTYVGSEHILFCLASEADSVASNILTKHGVKEQRLKYCITEYSGAGTKSSLTPKDMTPRARNILENSYRVSVKYGALKIGTEHILAAILEEKESVASKILMYMGVDMLALGDEVITVMRTSQKHFDNVLKKDTHDSALSKYGKNLTELAKKNKIDPFIGREAEIERLVRILSRKTKNNPCLVGEAGVGKTAIVEGLALKIANKDVPYSLLDKKIISVDLTSMIAGAKYRGDFEERIKKLIEEASDNPSVILFIDEIHTIVGAGAAEGAIDAANILKPKLSRSEIQIIGATTYKEFHKYIEKDDALERRFQKLIINEPSKEQTYEILHGIKKVYEKHHNLDIPDNILEKIVELSDRYITNRNLPDKAIDILDEACSKEKFLFDMENDKILDKKIKNKEFYYDEAEYENMYSFDTGSECGQPKQRRNILNINTVYSVLNEATGIPVSGLKTYTDLNSIRAVLKETVIGQSSAIDSLINSLIRSEVGLTNKNRPKAVFLFVGSTGVGKTELAKLLSKEFFRNDKSLIKLDMSEYSEPNSVTKLIGSPPGYVGFEEGGLLTEAVKNQPYSVVLFDEVEKASKDVLNLLLQIMDEGVIKDSYGRQTSFKNCYIIMTSNAMTNRNTSRNLGFLSENELKNEKLLEYFSAEFLNRIDTTVLFNDFTIADLELIAKQKLDAFVKKMQTLDVAVKYDFEVSEYIAKKAYTEKMGARAINRIILNEIEIPLSMQVYTHPQIKDFKLETAMEKIDIVFNEELLSEKEKALN